MRWACLLQWVCMHQGLQLACDGPGRVGASLSLYANRSAVHVYTAAHSSSRHIAGSRMGGNGTRTLWREKEKAKVEYWLQEASHRQRRVASRHDDWEKCRLQAEDCNQESREWNCKGACNAVLPEKGQEHVKDGYCRQGNREGILFSCIQGCQFRKTQCHVEMILAIYQRRMIEIDEV